MADAPEMNPAHFAYPHYEASDLRGSFAAFAYMVLNTFYGCPRPVNSLVGFDMDSDCPTFADICEYPAEDTPRLMAADWFDERADELGEKYGAAYRARAELIRTQIQIARGPTCPVCKKTGRFSGSHKDYCALMKIDVEATDIKPDRLVSHVCTCPYYDLVNRVSFILNSSYHVQGAAVKADKEIRVKGVDLFRPSQLFSAREVRYLRGFVGLASYGTESFLNAARAIAKAAPLEMVVLADRQLLANGLPFGKIGYLWAPWEQEPDGRYTAFPHPSGVLPEAIWRLAYALRDKDSAETSDDCYRWVSWATVVYARGLAKMKPWSARPPRALVFPMYRDGLPSVWFNPEQGGTARVIDPHEFSTSHALLAHFGRRDSDVANYKGMAARRIQDAFRGRPEYEVPDDYPDGRFDPPTDGTFGFGVEDTSLPFGG